MNLKHVLLALFSISVLVSCNKEVVKVPNGITLEGADEMGLVALDYSADVSGQTITFEADGSWQVDIPDDCGWLTATPSSGVTKGKETVSVVLSVEQNTDYKSRTTVVYLLCNGREQHDYLSITQAEAFFREVKFSHANAKVTAAAADYKLPVSVTNLEDWTPSASESWVKVKKNSLNELSFSLDENISGEERSANIRLTAEAAGKVYTSDIKVHQLPVKADADMLDLVFNPEDGTAKDISKSNRKVYSFPTPENLVVERDEMLGYDVARFTHAWGDHAPGTNHDKGAYTVADYDMQAEFNDGFTLEAYVKPAQDAIEKESKIISSTRSGGYSLMHAKKLSEGFTFIFYASLGGAKGNYVWVKSGIPAQKDVWYHLIATFDQKSGIARLYVNGKKTEVSAVDAVLKYSNKGKNSYMTVGGNSSSEKCTAENPYLYAMFNGTVAVARVYSDGLTEEQIPAADINLLPGRIQLYN